MNIYDQVTAKILELLQSGTIPWKKPWISSDGPMNLASKKPYRGINSFLLNCSPYGSPYWLTYRQAAAMGGQVKKGEKSSNVVFWKWLDAKAPTEKDDNYSSSGKIPLLRYYNIFNLQQIDGIKAPVEEQTINPFTPIEQAEQIISNMPQRPDIKHGGDRAFYNPAYDHIRLPNRESFISPEEYYSTAFHELGHATGHSSRLSRQSILKPAYFGSHDYSQEELVAEFASSMVCGVAGIEQRIIKNSAAYIQGWMKALKDDTRLAVIAAGQAQKAADFILNLDQTE